MFIWGSLDEDEFAGITTARLLYRVSDTPAVDFYTTAGMSLTFESYGVTETMFSGVGGIEFSFPFARRLAWNVEFGIAFSIEGNLTMALGTGIHFYF